MYKINSWFFVFPLFFLIGCAGAPPGEPGTGAGPGWIYNITGVYSEDQFVSAVGYGTDRESAEKDALRSLVSIFGQTVQGETETRYRYSEAVTGGAVDMRENREIESAVKTSVAMDSLIGADIRDYWTDNRNAHYAAAVMDRKKCYILYSDLIDSNRGIIRDLLDISGEDRYSLEAYARYGLAALLADTNTAFTNVLAVLRPGPGAALEDEGLPGEYYRLQAREIAENIPIMVQVAGDRESRIGAAFGTAVSGSGFRTGGTGSRYVLEVSFSLTPAELPGNKNQFVRYVVDANLRDTRTGQVLFPYSINGREGHITLSEAEDRAVRAAEDRIRESYAESLRSYLTLANRTGGS